MLLKGGPRTQVLQSKRALERLDVQVSLYDSWRELSGSDVDLVHLFGANIGTYHLARELHRTGIPFVVSPIFFTRKNTQFVRGVVAVDSFVRTFANGFWSDYGLITDICKWAKLVLPNTTHEAKLVEEGFGIPNEKIIVVPNGVEERFYYATPELFVQKYGIENFILNVGHIGPERKNVFRLIQALETIRHPAVIIGRVEQSEEAERCLSEAKKNSRLTIIEYLPNDSDMLASAYAACDTFVLPGLFETPGIAALEAGLAGAKLVVTKHGGTTDYFRDDAEYIEPASVESIGSGIVKSLGKPKAMQLREHIRKEFVWERVGEKLRNVYESLLSK